jgi:hypothetical protein
VVVIGDDPWPAAKTLGPHGWACARGAKRWSPNSVIVHGTGGHADHYRLASQAVLFCRRVLLIETDSAHIQEWAEFIDCPNTLIFRPPGENVHPEPPAREAMQ